MTLKRWEPLREIDDMLDRYARALVWRSGRDKSLSPTGDWAPHVDISETDDEFVVDAELPDVNKDGVKISLDNGILSIQGERKQEKEEKGRTFHRIERYYGNFSDRKSTRLNSSHVAISYAVFCLKKKNK